VVDRLRKLSDWDGDILYDADDIAELQIDEANIEALEG
jgi:hypothetical protein